MARLLRLREIQVEEVSGQGQGLQAVMPQTGRIEVRHVVARRVVVLGRTQEGEIEPRQPGAKPVFDLESGALIAAASRLTRDGPLHAAQATAASPCFFVGSADTPIDPPPGWRPDRLRAKIEAGAGFVQTQFCFDLAVIRRYAARLREEGLTERAFVLIGIGPIASARSAHWMRKHLGGTIIPDAVIDRLAAAPDPRAEGIRICAELMQALAEIPGIAGAHLMSPRNDGAIAEAIQAAAVVRDS